MKARTDYQEYINALRKCAKEHDKDRTLTGHIIVSNLCRDTANLLEELEQELNTGHWRLIYQGLPELNEESESTDVYITYRYKGCNDVERKAMTIAKYGTDLLSSDDAFYNKAGWLTIKGRELECEDVIAWMPLPEIYESQESEG